MGWPPVSKTSTPAPHDFSSEAAYSAARRTSPLRSGSTETDGISTMSERILSNSFRFPAAYRARASLENSLPMGSPLAKAGGFYYGGERVDCRRGDRVIE